MYVITKTSGPRRYVARPGMEHSYTRQLEDARIYPTRKAAEGDRCQENETIHRLIDVVRGA